MWWAYTWGGAYIRGAYSRRFTLFAFASFHNIKRVLDYWVYKTKNFRNFALSNLCAYN